MPKKEKSKKLDKMQYVLIGWNEEPLFKITRLCIGTVDEKIERYIVRTLNTAFSNFYKRKIKSIEDKIKKHEDLIKKLEEEYGQERIHGRKMGKR